MWVAGDKGGARFKPPKTREKLKSIEKFQPHLLVSTSDLCKWWTYCCEIVQDAQEHPLQDAAPYILWKQQNALKSFQKDQLKVAVSLQLIQVVHPNHAGIPRLYMTRPDSGSSTTRSAWQGRFWRVCC